jgi:hypothetical protein
VQKYRCHKIVEAQDLKDKRVRLTANGDGSVSVWIDNGSEHITIPANKINHLTAAEVEDGYVVRYLPDDYISWSPRKAFEDGYAAIPPDASHGGDGKKDN